MNDSQPVHRLVMAGHETSPPALRPQAPQDGHIRISPIIPAPEVLRQMGHDADPIILAAGLEKTAFGDPETIVPYAAVGRFLALCAERTNCPHIGLIIGGRRGVGALGTVGMLVREAPDVHSGLTDLVRYLGLHDRGAVPLFSAEPDRFTISYAIYAQTASGSDIISDIAAVIGFNLVRELCGVGALPTDVFLIRAKPADPTPYQRFFQAPVRFGAETTGLAFSSGLLARRIDRADPDLRRLLVRQIEQLESTVPSNFSGWVRRIAAMRIADGDCSIDHVARIIGINKRTLNRRLSAEGTSFRQLLEETRLQAAQQMLADNSIPLAQIAVALGYSEASAFTRAFQRWCGFCPLEWRSRKGSMAARNGAERAVPVPPRPKRLVRTTRMHP
jgi:AraC-like DNA-binding protein